MFQQILLNSGFLWIRSINICVNHVHIYTKFISSTQFGKIKLNISAPDNITGSYAILDYYTGPKKEMQKLLIVLEIISEYIREIWVDG